MCTLLNIFADACCYVSRQISGGCAFTFDGIASWIEYTTSILHHGDVLLSPGSAVNDSAHHTQDLGIASSL